MGRGSSDTILITTEEDSIKAVVTVDGVINKIIITSNTINVKIQTQTKTSIRIRISTPIRIKTKLIITPICLRKETNSVASSV